MKTPIHYAKIVRTIIISALMTLSLISIGQTSNDYKDYNPCTTCGPVITNSNNSNKSESNPKSMGVVKKDVINLRPFGRRVKGELKKTTEMVLIATLTIVSTALIGGIK